MSEVSGSEDIGFTFATGPDTRSQHLPVAEAAQPQASSGGVTVQHPDGSRPTDVVMSSKEGSSQYRVLPSRVEPTYTVRLTQAETGQRLPAGPTTTSQVDPENKDTSETYDGTGSPFDRSDTVDGERGMNPRLRARHTADRSTTSLGARIIDSVGGTVGKVGTALGGLRRTNEMPMPLALAADDSNNSTQQGVEMAEGKLSGSEILIPEYDSPNQLIVNPYEQTKIDAVYLPPKKGMYVELGGITVMPDTQLPPQYRPVLRHRVTAALHEIDQQKEAAYVENEYHGERLISDCELRQQVPSAVGERINTLLPEAILDSPAATFIRGEAQGRGLAMLVHSVKDVRDRFNDYDLLPYTKIHQVNPALQNLAACSIKFGIEEVIVDISPFDAVSDTAKALSASPTGKRLGLTPTGTSTGLKIIAHAEDGVVSKTGPFYVDALQMAQLIEGESIPGGRIPGRSDTTLQLNRPNGVTDPTFQDTVGMIQHPEDPDITMVFSIAPGQGPMAGRRNDNPETDCGTLQIEAVGVLARPFEMPMASALNAPTTSLSESVDTARGTLRRITETRDRIDLIKAVRVLTDRQFLGRVSTYDYSRAKVMAQIESDPGDNGIVDATVIED